MCSITYIKAEITINVSTQQTYEFISNRKVSSEIIEYFCQEIYEDLAPQTMWTYNDNVCNLKRVAKMSRAFWRALCKQLINKKTIN